MVNGPRFENSKKLTHRDLRFRLRSYSSPDRSLPTFVKTTARQATFLFFFLLFSLFFPRFPPIFPQIPPFPPDFPRNYTDTSRNYTDTTRNYTDFTRFPPVFPRFPPKTPRFPPCFLVESGFLGGKTSFLQKRSFFIVRCS